MDFSFHDIEKSFIEAMESCGLSPCSRRAAAHGRP